MDLNLELRTIILKHSLTIENRLSDILLTLFHIERNDSRSLGFKASALSFKNKVDLLDDLGLFSDEHYNEKYGIMYRDLIFFMEVRNQFMHNLDADNMIEVLIRLEKLNTLKKKMQKYKRLGIVDDGTEEMYIKAFEQMSYYIDGRLYEFKNDIVEEQDARFREEVAAESNERFVELIPQIIGRFLESLNDENEQKLFQKFSEYFIECVLSDEVMSVENIQGEWKNHLNKEK